MLKTSESQSGQGNYTILTIGDVPDKIVSASLAASLSILVPDKAIVFTVVMACWWQ